jgi:predicted RNase H-like nuclease
MSSECLLVGFNSAWTARNSGGIIGVVRTDNGLLVELGEPTVADFPQAEKMIRAWQERLNPKRTLILLDQPTIVRNASEQRAVENIVGAAIGRRRGGVKPANTSRIGMFCPDAPLRRFLGRFG